MTHFWRDQVTNSPTRTSVRTRRAAAALAAGAAFALSACQVKDTRDQDEEPAPEATETTLISPDPTPSPTASSGVSIIRPDLEDAPVMRAPAEPENISVAFPDGGYSLSGRATGALRSLVASDAVEEGWPIVLRGHTDSEGDDQGNIFASRKRAEAVAGWLTDNGVDEDRIEIIALGEQRPVAPNANLDGTPNEAGRRANRRVDVWVGKPGSTPPEDEAIGAAGEEREERPISEPRVRRTASPEAAR